MMESLPEVRLRRVAPLAVQGILGSTSPELLGIQGPKYAPERVMRGDAVGQLQILTRPLLLGSAKISHGYIVIACADNHIDDDGQGIHSLVTIQAPSGKEANPNRGFGVQGDAQQGLVCIGDMVNLVHLVKDGVGLRNLFQRKTFYPFQLRRRDGRS
jgi:hypothetical protein